MIFRKPFFYWYARLDSNQRLSAPEADALSPELRAHFAQIFTANEPADLKSPLPAWEIHA